MANTTVNLTSTSGPFVHVEWDLTIILSLSMLCLIILVVLIISCCCMCQFIYKDNNTVGPTMESEEPFNSYALDLPPIHQSPIRRPSTPVALANCPRRICDEYIRNLSLPCAYFKPSCDECYCPIDYLGTRPKIGEVGGYKYTVPCGWVLFALKIDATFTRDKSIFQKWTTSYYSISADKLEPILRNRFIPVPGDKLLDGNIFSACIYDDNGYYCTSPSINYISERYRHLKTRFPSQDGNSYEMQIILQCKQQPDTFEKKKGEANWCQIMSRNEIRWESKRRSTIVPCAIMVRARRFVH